MIDSAQTFRWRLAEAIAWYTFQSAADPNYSLRSAPLQPTEIEGYASTSTSSYPWEEAVSSVAMRRVQHLQENGKYPYVPAKTLVNGRLLLYYPDANLADGTAEVYSEGFFDLQNIPPWDAWVWFSRDHSPVDITDTEIRGWSESYRRILLSWVPPQFVEHADKGIWSNPEMCICWLPTDVEMEDVLELLQLAGNAVDIGDSRG